MLLESADEHSDARRQIANGPLIDSATIPPENVMRARSRLGLAIAGLTVASLALGAAPLAARQRAQEAAFKATLVPIRGDKALDFWYRTPTSSGPSLSVVERVNPNDAVLLLVLLEGIGDAGRGKGQVTLRVSTIDPAGETEILAEDVPAWDDTLPAKGILTISRAVLEFYFDDKEPAGTTTIVVEATDAGSGTTARTEAALELVPWSYGLVPDDEHAGDWVTDYYRAPAPGQAVRAYLEYADVESKKTEGWNYAVLGFYRTIFQGSPWLVDHLVGRFEGADNSQQMKIIAMLHLVGQGERIEQLPFGDEASRKKVRAEAEKLVLPDPYAPIEGPVQLDLLWGEFLATGRYAPVRQLVTALDLAPFEDDVEAFPKSKKTEKDKQRFLKGVTFQAARWSLDSNMKQHPLVLAYATQIAEQEKLGKDARKQLEALLEKHRR